MAKKEFEKRTQKLRQDLAGLEIVDGTIPLSSMTRFKKLIANTGHPELLHYYHENSGDNLFFLFDFFDILMKTPEGQSHLCDAFCTQGFLEELAHIDPVALIPKLPADLQLKIVQNDFAIQGIGQYYRGYEIIRNIIATMPDEPTKIRVITATQLPAHLLLETLETLSPHGQKQALEDKDGNVLGPLGEAYAYDADLSQKITEALQRLEEPDILETFKVVSHAAQKSPWAATGWAIAPYIMNAVERAEKIRALNIGTVSPKPAPTKTPQIPDYKNDDYDAFGI